MQSGGANGSSTTTIDRQTERQTCACCTSYSSANLSEQSLSAVGQAMHDRSI